MTTKVPQYTIRNMPPQVNAYLRKKAKLTGRSLNQVIIDELSEKAGLDKDGKPQSLLESLDWFIGSGSDPEVDAILAEEDQRQRAIAGREMAKLDEISRQFDGNGTV